MSVVLPIAGSGTSSNAVRIEGTGPVSSLLALLLLRQGFPAEELRLDSPRRELPAALAERALALSYGSWLTLGRVIDTRALGTQAGTIAEVDVSLAGHAGRVCMRAQDMGVPALGHVVRYRTLQDSLEAAVHHATIQRTPAADVPVSAPGVIVHADGDTGPDAGEIDFGQSALLAEVQCEPVAADRHHVAWERFTAEGPLAMLPLPEPGRFSLVWCAPREVVERRLSIDDDALVVELSEAFGPWIGSLRLAGARHSAPLVRRKRQRVIDGRDVWIGNAAQALHPVAGQGLNLGIRDAFELAEALGAARARGLEPASALPGYLRRRRPDRDGVIVLTDALARVFTVGALRPLQSVALTSLELAAPLRHGLARRFMFGMR